MKSYREKFQEKIDREITAFRERTLTRPAQEIYDDAYRIHFYEFMYDYLGAEEFTAKEYKMFLQSDGSVLENLRNIALDFDEFNVGNPTDASCLVDAYFQDCAKAAHNCM